MNFLISDHPILSPRYVNFIPIKFVTKMEIGFFHNQGKYFTLDTRPCPGYLVPGGIVNENLLGINLLDVEIFI